MYQWFVFVHLLGLVLFAMCHGVSLFVVFRVRRVAEPAVAAGLLQLSKTANQVMYLGLLLLAIGGVGAAATNGLWEQTWIRASIVVFTVVVGLMYLIASTYYYPLRDQLAGKDGAEPMTAAELAERLSSRRPEWLAITGGIGLIVLIWLMVLKPV